MQEISATSGLAQVTFAVLLGWPLAGLHAGMERIGPLVNIKRVVQAHLDNIFMGMLQRVVASAFPGLPVLAGWLMVVGSWCNPQLFLYQATARKRSHEIPGVKPLALVSFSSLTVAYLW